MHPIQICFIRSSPRHPDRPNSKRNGIDDHIDDAHRVGRAVAAGTETRTIIGALNQEVEPIGVMADMIGEIAARTNLLALNATSEAARPGPCPDHPVAKECQANNGRAWA